MTDRVQPGAIDSIVRNDELAQVFGQFSEGWIVKPSSPPTPASIRRPEIDETALNGFGLVATSGFDITIDAGEGFVSGWCARDSQTTITVPGSTTSTVVLAWSLDAVFDPDTDSNRDLADEVRVDLATNVDAQYPSTELFDVTADSNSITSTTDRRRLGATVVADQVVSLDSLTDPAGVTHTDELADAADPVTDFGVGSIADGELLQNSGGSLTGTTQTADLITEAVASNDVEVILSLAGFDSYIIQISDLNPTIPQDNFSAQFSDDGGATFFSQADYGTTVTAFNGQSVVDGKTSTRDTQIRIAQQVSGPSSFDIQLDGVNQSANTQLNGTGQGDTPRSFIIGGELDLSQSVNAIRFFFSNSDINTGTFRVFGVN
jgi:hypothetical protein